MSSYSTPTGLKVESRLVQLGGPGSEGIDFCEVTLTSDQQVHATVHIVVKDVGPAGARIQSMGYLSDEGCLRVNGGIIVQPEAKPSEGLVIPADTDHDSPVGLLSYRLDLAAKETYRLAFRVRHDFSQSVCGALAPKTLLGQGLSIEEGIAKICQSWQSDLPARIWAPDLRIAKRWEQLAFHTLSAMEVGQPRIGAVNYPVFWMRDCVLVLRSLDLIGRHDLARSGLNEMAPIVFTGGFGAESDAPGEGIWALVSHALITRDVDWLRAQWTHIESRIGWLDRMLSTCETIRVVGQNRMPGYLDGPAINVQCLSSKDGLIQGRMDWHSPNFFINCWAVAGYRMAAAAAQLLGDPRTADWSARADELERRIAAYLLPSYGDNPRDAIVSPHPTGTLANSVQEGFRRYFLQERYVDGQRLREPEWTYFEAAQIHNAFLLGMREQAWSCLSEMLDDGKPWDVAAYIEGGANEFLPFRNGADRRGWIRVEDDLGGNMPHMWTTAELLCLLRGMFVREEGDEIVLGAGVPQEWLVEGASFGAKELPTNQGLVSFEAKVSSDGSVRVICSSGQRVRLSNHLTRA